ncbi:MAG TPA: family 16 glycoside hydrolase [Anaerolineales bacterium]|nr:family 16 glycoside hydrolase [Anaerolineales bacterium]
MFVEDQIAALRQQKVESPLAWLICFEGRPLQGIPPKGKGPHLLLFSTEARAQACIAGRKKYYGEEPLAVIGVDSPDSLRGLALNPSGDARYAAPPCGLVLDFDYSTKKARKVLAPAVVGRKSPADLVAALGIKTNIPAAVPVPPPAPAVEPNPVPAPLPSRQRAATPPPPRPKKKSALVAVLITCGILLLLCLLVLCIGGVWYGVSRGIIPVPPFLATPTPTPLPASWETNTRDDFSANLNGWPIGSDNGQYGSSYLSIMNGKLMWEVDSIKDCWYWWYPDLPNVSDFDISVDVQRTGGSTTGDYGIIFRSNSDNDAFYYVALNDTNQRFGMFLYQYDTWNTIVDWKLSKAIKPGAVNRLDVTGTGGHFVISINGKVVGQADDYQLPTGKFGILAKLVDSSDKILLEYDNLVLHGNK